MERIGGDVRRALSRFGAPGGMTEVVAAWPEVVGEVVARNAWPARLGRDGTLHVSTSSSAWAFELAQLELEVAARLAHVLGEDEPRRIRFAPGRLPEASVDTVPKASRAPTQISGRARARAAEIAAPVGDEELRSLLERAAAVSLGRVSDDRSL
jgi:hypothetical protein